MNGKGDLIDKLSNLSKTDRRIVYVSLFFGVFYWGLILVDWAMHIT